jgi:hypothetical protein
MLIRIQNSFLRKPIAMILILALFNLSFKAPKGTVTVKAGTKVSLELMSRIDSSVLTAGEIVDFKVKYDVEVDDQIVIAAGSVAKGQVIRASEAKMIGKPGEVEIEIKTLKAIDGQEIPLTSPDIFKEGKDKQVLAIVGVLLCILTLLIKGEEAQIMAGKSFEASVATNVDVNVEE